MATWIAHLRVAEEILKKGYQFDIESFVIGNIGPDSGVPNEDWSSFNPPKKLTHWLGEDKKIDAEAFKDKYIDNKIYESEKEFSFIIGYYVHLLTDIEWGKLYAEKKKISLYKDGLDKDADFIWTIKKDWYGLDYLYLEKNPDNIFNTVFKNVDNVPDYLDYFPKGAFEKKVKYIIEFYLGENDETKDNFIYLTEKEMDKFIVSATKNIDDALKLLLN